MAKEEYGKVKTRTSEGQAEFLKTKTRTPEGKSEFLKIKTNGDKNDACKK